MAKFKVGDVVLYRDPHSGERNPNTGLPRDEESWHPVSPALVLSVNTTPKTPIPGVGMVDSPEGALYELEVHRPTYQAYPPSAASGRSVSEVRPAASYTTHSHEGKPGQLGRCWGREESFTPGS